MATLDPQTAPVDGGVALSTVAASSGGDEAPVGNGRLLYVTVASGAASSVDVTVTTPRTVRGLDIEDVTATVAPGGTWLLPLTRMFRNPSTGRADVSYTSAADVSVAVVEPEQ